MKKYLKVIGGSIGIITTVGAYAVNAQNRPLFNFSLNVEGVSNPQILVGSGRRALAQTGSHSYNVKADQNDYTFIVKYEHNGTKEAICQISGVPTRIKAIINPQTNKCLTETFRG